MVFDAIRDRRSIRSYLDKPVEEEKLTAVLEAARLAPSANNLQNWRFIAVTDPEAKARVIEAAYGQPCLQQAPVAIVACGLKPGRMTCGQPVEAVDVSIAVSFMLLAAHEQGLGTCWLAYFDQEKMKAALGIPQGASVVAVTPLGYPAETPEPRPRKPLEDVTSRDHF